MLGSLPPFDEMFQMAGMELPDYLKGSKKEAPQKDNNKEVKKEEKKQKERPQKEDISEADIIED